MPCCNASVVVAGALHKHIHHTEGVLVMPNVEEQDTGIASELSDTEAALVNRIDEVESRLTRNEAAYAELDALVGGLADKTLSECIAAVRLEAGNIVRAGTVEIVKDTGRAVWSGVKWVGNKVDNVVKSVVGVPARCRKSSATA